MKVKETRGRKRKHDFSLKKGQTVSFAEPNNKTVQILALAFARNKGWKFRTWNDVEKVEGNDVNKLFVKRIS